jgi:cytoskeleton protein RodZ
MSSEHEEQAGTAPDAPMGGAGAQLRAAREALNLDLKHIAAQTRIPVRHLEVIESGDFESLPSRAYAIGFTRTFAKAVGLDPAVMTDVVRAELADGSMQRAIPVSAMEPGDPARLPSSGLAWAGALAALVLAVGAYAFYNAYFGAGTEPGSLLTSAPAAVPKPVASTAAAEQAKVAGGEVVLTATEDGIWLRLYIEGGERLVERTLKQGETVLVPSEAIDPRINTGRPDALSITIDGKPVAKLAERPTTLSGVPVSSAALLARSAPAAAATATDTTAIAPPRPAARRTAGVTSQPASSTVDAAPAMVADASASTAAPDSSDN